MTMLSGTKRIAVVVFVAAVLLAVAPRAAAAQASTPTPADPLAASATTAVHYYLALGDSLAEGYQPKLDLTHGYAQQLYAALKPEDPSLELKNLACGGDRTSSMISGLLTWGALSARGTSAATARGWRSSRTGRNWPTRAFVGAHNHKVSMITIDIGGNDVSLCLASADPECFQEGLAQVQTTCRILTDLRAGGPGVPIVGLTYYDVVAPICVSDPFLAFLCNEVDTLNATLTTDTPTPATPVADVPGPFENDNLPAAAVHVCAWTWFCTLGDVHANTAGYGVIAQAFEPVIP